MNLRLTLILALALAPLLGGCGGAEPAPAPPPVVEADVTSAAPLLLVHLTGLT